MSTVLTMLFAYYLLLLSTPFSTLFYEYSPENFFIVGRLYPLLILPVALMLFSLLVGVIRRKDKLSSAYYSAFLIALLPMTPVIFLHMIVSVFALIHASFSLSAMAMYIIILSTSRSSTWPSSGRSPINASIL